MNAATRASEIPTARTTLDRKRVYIFPTRHGIMLGAMMFVILLGSINYDNALGYLLVFLLFGLFLIGVLHTYRNLAGLSFLGAQAKPVFAGSPAEFKLSLDNRRNWQGYSVELAHWPRVRSRWWRRRKTPARCFTATVPSNEISTIDLRIITQQRGWLALGRVRIASVFPLGILRAWGYFESHAQCLVYPRPVGHLPLPLGGYAIGSNEIGGAPGNDDFAGFRPYEPGDPIRAISWKTLAKQDALVVKRFTSGGADRIHLRWEDCPASMDLEMKLSQLSQWVLEAQKQGMVYGLELPGIVIAPDQNPSHQNACLEALALYRAP